MEIVPESRPITHFLWEWKCLGKPCNHQKVNLVDKSLERMLVGLKWLTVLGSYDHQYLCWPTKWTLSAQRELYLELRFIRTKVLSSRIESGGIQGDMGCHKNILLPLAVNFSNICAVLVLREAYLRVCPEFLIGGQSPTHFLPAQPAIITEIQTPTGMHMFIVNYTFAQIV